MDGSGFYLTVSNYTNATVFDANGNQIYPSIIDPNGNTFSSDSSGNLVDTLGRTPVTQSTNGNTIVYNVLTVGGQRKQYTVTTETLSLSTSFKQSGVHDYTGTITAIQSIELPDGSSYSFTYESGYGELQTITLPTGGTISFSYQNYLDSYKNQNRWLQSYSGGLGWYSFSPSVVTSCSSSKDTGCKEQIDVFDGSGNKTTYVLTLNNGAWNSQTTVYSGNTETATPVISTINTFDYSNSAPSWFGAGSMWVTGSNSTTTLSDTNQTSQARYTYSNPQWGKPTKVEMWDYGVPTSSTASKETDYTYGYIVNHAPLVTQVVLKDAAGTLAAKTQYEYDDQNDLNSSCPTTGAPSGTHGNLTCVIRGTGSPVITSSGYDSNGTKLSDTDGRGYTTSYDHMCSSAYVSKVTSPVTVNGTALNTQASFDCSTGLPNWTKDMNLNQTTYTYYTSGPNIGKSLSVSYPDGGSTSWAYPSYTEVDQTTAQTSSVNVTTKAIRDSFGRNYQTITAAPEGSISSEISYDANGRPSCVTTAHLSSRSNTDGTTCTTLDVLGRVTKQAMPDKNAINITYSGNTQAVTNEIGNGKKYTFDAFHRLTTVLEPNASGTLAYETDYAYNGVDQLTEVDQWGGSTTPVKRIFFYDGLGQKIAENIPENQSAASPAHLTSSDANGTWTTLFGYDGNGNLITTLDNANNSVTYNYDGLNRLTSESQAGGVSYSYVYDGTDGYTHTNPLGNMTLSKNNNASAGSSLSYDSMGRLANQNDCVPGNCNYSASGINVGADYDLAGNMTSLTYPDGRVVGQLYDGANRLSGVQYSQWGSTSVNTPYYNVNSYAPPGQETRATMGNGVELNSVFNSRQALAWRIYSTPTKTLWSKHFLWDKNGSNLLLAVDNITGYGRQYTYDPLNRVTSAVDVGVNNSGSTRSQAIVTVLGSERTTTINPCAGNTYPAPNSCPVQIPDAGTISLVIKGVVAGTAQYGSSSTQASVATDLTTSIISNSNSPVEACYMGSGGQIKITSKLGGNFVNYTLAVTAATTITQYFSGSSFSISAPSAMAGGTGAPPSNGMNETYAYDPFGNLTQSGNAGSFSLSANGLNQISGYGYDANGNQTSDIWGHPLAYDANGMLSSVSGGQETYTYDGQGNRVAITDGASSTKLIYFGGTPVAILQGTTYTDLIYAGGSLLAEVTGTQNAVPLYRMTDQLGSPSATDYAPYGQQFAGTSGDPFGFTGLYWDPTTSMWHAGARQFSPQMGRWMSADPYGGSYNWSDPQSLNRYAYVNGRAMAATDPSGLDGGDGSGTNGSIFNPQTYLADLIVGFLNASNFHGSLKPRPNANPWNDRFGVPYGGLGSSAQQALGLPTMADVGCNPICNATREGAPNVDLAWWGDFFSAINWQNIKQSQIDAWNKGYYKCVQQHTIGGVFAPVVTHAVGMAATNATERAAPMIAGAYYHFTDARFTAWGRYSKVLVPKLAPKIAAAAEALDVAGWAYFDYELFNAGRECSGIVF